MRIENKMFSKDKRMYEQMAWYHFMGLNETYDIIMVPIFRILRTEFIDKPENYR